MVVSLSRWTMPVLRVGMGIFLILWGIDKLAATEGSQRIFENFYKLDVGALVPRAAGVLEILLGVALAVGLLRVSVAWISLVANTISTLASWKQILDPWGWFGLTKGGTHLFLASLVIVAANIVIVLNARDDTWTLDRKFGRTGAREH
ncbi:MAG: DoxX family membrane protein [Gemmatimonadetes bacterium]|nr:DoxX family membrane protein [Gemmatimonadota bacterium]